MQTSSAATSFGVTGSSFALGGTTSPLTPRCSCIGERSSFPFAEGGNAVVKQELLCKRPLQRSATQAGLRSEAQSRATVGERRTLRSALLRREL